MKPNFGPSIDLRAHIAASEADRASNPARRETQQALIAEGGPLADYYAARGTLAATSS